MKQKGFTLLEFIIVGLILGIFVSIFISAFSSTPEDKIRREKNKQLMLNDSVVCIQGYKFVDKRQMIDEKGGAIPCYN